MVDPAAIQLEFYYVDEKINPFTGQSAVSSGLTHTVKSSSVSVEQGTVGLGHFHTPVELLTLVISIKGLFPNLPHINLSKVFD